MSFHISIDETTDLCDKCRKPMDAQNPGLWLCTQGRARMDRNQIFIHEACLSKAIKEAKGPSVLFQNEEKP